jgi:FixJ family two-component response regulator
MVAFVSEPVRVIFLDDDEDLRRTMDELLRFFGIECTSFGTFGELRSSKAAVSDFSVAILDVNLGSGEPTGIDAYAWLRESGFRGRIAFLTGHGRSHPQLERFAEVGDATVLEKPITTDDLIDYLRVGAARAS